MTRFLLSCCFVAAAQAQWSVFNEPPIPTEPPIPAWVTGPSATSSSSFSSPTRSSSSSSWSTFSSSGPSPASPSPTSSSSSGSFSSHQRVQRGTAASCVTPSGDVTTKSFSLTGFSGIDLRTLDASLTVVQSDTFAVSASGKSDALDALDMTKSGSNLMIDLKANTCLENFGSISFTVSLPSLSALATHSASTVTSQGTLTGGSLLKVDQFGDGSITLALSAQTVEVKLMGFGTVTLSGSATDLKVDMQGDGRVEAFGLEAGNAQVEALGSGTVRVNARNTISANVMGGTNVEYRGSPTVSRSIAGFGSVTQAAGSRRVLRGADGQDAGSAPSRSLFSDVSDAFGAAVRQLFGGGYSRTTTTRRSWGYRSSWSSWGGSSRREWGSSSRDTTIRRWSQNSTEPESEPFTDPVSTTEEAAAAPTEVAPTEEVAEIPTEAPTPAAVSEETESESEQPPRRSLMESVSEAFRAAARQLQRYYRSSSSSSWGSSSSTSPSGYRRSRRWGRESSETIRRWSQNSTEPESEPFTDPVSTTEEAAAAAEIPATTTDAEGTDTAQAPPRSLLSDVSDAFGAAVRQLFGGGYSRTTTTRRSWGYRSSWSSWGGSSRREWGSSSRDTTIRRWSQNSTEPESEPFTDPVSTTEEAAAAPTEVAPTEEVAEIPTEAPAPAAVSEEIESESEQPPRRSLMEFVSEAFGAAARQLQRYYRSSSSSSWGSSSSTSPSGYRRSRRWGRESSETIRRWSQDAPTEPESEPFTDPVSTQVEVTAAAPETPTATKEVVTPAVAVEPSAVATFLP
uniref:Putative auto-transporter adhesin head GIN domain-containing protein n=1 Tax=Chromera velia CCMP2878 TaxID=1169474 RepID=A0A0G4HLI2_9ALVE|eukprot:Cvel_7355.t1-p1 / transcript=Cvel_7355.t1 / gene=Cvel_7355 / organism=Chromera_velia_CCMP2878 / gene_product=hypothetical protein / transcript_product=hypothetical protein / location=Cvel_scaffold382:1827-5649(+) / protein_length=793 / sequence_SO=supercontig / SO=protein_coding / is_pseudo=false